MHIQIKYGLFFVALFVFSCREPVHTRLDISCGTDDDTIEIEADSIKPDFENIDFDIKNDTETIPDEDLAPQIIVLQKGSDNTDIGYGIASDKSGGIYIVGSSDGAIDSNTNQGLTDYFLMKFNCNGTYLWTKMWGTPNIDIAQSVICDNEGFVYMTGWENALGGDLTGQIFFSKHDSNGNEIFKKYWGANTDGKSYSLAIDTDGYIYAGGLTYGLIDGDVNKGVSDSFLTKFDKDGNIIWKKQWGGLGLDTNDAIAIDSKGNIYSTGQTFSTIDNLTNQGAGDIFVTKYDSAGSYLWTKLFGTTESDYARAISIGEDDSLYITGGTQGSFGGFTLQGNSDSFILKLDENGSMKWIKQWGGTGSDNINASYMAKERLFVSGIFSGTLETESKGLNDIFFTDFDSDGLLVKTMSWGTISDDRSFGITGFNNDVYMTGWILEELELDIPTGLSDVFLVILKNYIQ